MRKLATLVTQDKRGVMLFNVNFNNISVISWRDTRRRQTKQNNTIGDGRHYAQANTNNINKTLSPPTNKCVWIITHNLYVMHTFCNCKMNVV